MGGVIDTTCKICIREDYQECKIRKVLTKYGVYPIDPEATNRCQYCYGEALVLDQDGKLIELEKLWEQIGGLCKENAKFIEYIDRLTGELNIATEQIRDYVQMKKDIAQIINPDADWPENPGISYILSCIRKEWEQFDKTHCEKMQEIRSLKNTIESHEDVIKDLNFSINNWSKEYSKLTAKLAAAEECIETMKRADAEHEAAGEYPVTIGLASGGEFEYVLPEHMTEIVVDEIQKPKHFRGICAQYVSGKFVAIDLQEVVTLQVEGLPPKKDWVKTRTVQETSSATEIYKIDCKCGADYFADMNAGRAKARCRDCQSTVFADRQAEKVKDHIDGTEATLMTNRYFVSTEPRQVSDQGREIKADNIGRRYKEPCNIFD